MFQPIENNVLIKIFGLIEKDKERDDDNSTEDKIMYKLGKVIGVGPGWFNSQTGQYEPIPIAKGDTVLLRRYHQGTFNGGYCIVDSSEIQAVLEDD